MLGMRFLRTVKRLAIAAVLLQAPVLPQSSDSAVGIFESRTNVGTATLPGSVEYDAVRSEYRVTGGGANLWGKVDGFHFLWKRVSGDFTMTANIRVLSGSSIESHVHRKGVLMVRQELIPGSVYVDAAVHGDGSTALQFRLVTDDITAEIKPEVTAPAKVRIERRGNRFTMSYAVKVGDALVTSAPQVVEMRDPVYVGVAVSAHKTDARETVVFSNVSFEQR
jgi:regulation of enolase protein 1 (concanavalin A-like superfamily)